MSRIFPLESPARSLSWCVPYDKRVGIAYDLKLMSDDSPAPRLEALAALLLQLRGDHFHLTHDDERVENSYRSRRAQRKTEETITRPRFDFLLHLSNGGELVTTAISLEPGARTPGRYFEEPGCFAIIGFGAIKHVVWREDFEEKFGTGLVEFMVQVCQASGASRGYFFDDDSLYWRLNAHVIYYHPIHLYQKDIQRIRAEWMNGVPHLGVSAEGLQLENLGTFRDDSGVLRHSLNEWVQMPQQEMSLQHRLQEVDYLLNEKTDTLVLLGFPGPVRGYVDPFFLL